ncbi:hypothetical protein DQ237_17370 [Blastococcus sp. TF02-8]|nr:hypothetical protein DQ237_17370 [Blastococcus sp. TF02-8]
MGDMAEFDEETLDALERGRKGRSQILDGTERPDEDRTPYARTLVDIDFDDEEDLRACVRLLRWSDERLRARPEVAILWDWNATFRDHMRISFGVNWYDQAFYEARRDAFMEPAHTRYYAMFGATTNSLKMRHEVLDEKSGATGA